MSPRWGGAGGKSAGRIAAAPGAAGRPRRPGGPEAMPAESGLAPHALPAHLRAGVAGWGSAGGEPRPRGRRRRAAGAVRRERRRGSSEEGSHLPGWQRRAPPGPEAGAERGAELLSRRRGSERLSSALCGRAQRRKSGSASPPAAAGLSPPAAAASP